MTTTTSISTSKVLTIAHTLAQKVQHPPMCLLETPEGVIPIPGELPDEKHKDSFFKAVGLVAKEMNAHAVVFITEAWVTTIQKKTHDSVPTEEQLQAELREAKAKGVPSREMLVVSIEQRGKPVQLIGAEIGVEGGIGARKVGEWQLLGGNHGPAMGRATGLLGDLDGGEVV
jgi:hypothetical protein